MGVLAASKERAAKPQVRKGEILMTGHMQRRGTADPRLGYVQIENAADTMALRCDEFVHELAVRITASPQEAEAAIEEMMSDIHRTAAGPALTIVQRLRDRVALIRLLKFIR
jgi:hypothetical protein